MSDLISRQAAIDALIELYEYQRDIDPTEAADLVRQGIYLAEKKIEQLPSAQPEPIKINIDDFNKEDLERFKKELGNTPITVLPAQPEIIRCKDCKYRDENWRRVSVRWLPCMEVLTGSNWYCGSAERRTDG
jgi:hypothetical protein